MKLVRKSVKSSGKKKKTIDKNIIHPQAELTPLFRAVQDSEFGHALYPVHVCVHSIVTRAQNIKTSEHADHSPASVECNHSVSPFLCLSLPQRRLILTPHIGNAGNGYQITCYHSPLQRVAQGEWPPCSNAFTQRETHWHRSWNVKEKIFKVVCCLSDVFIIFFPQIAKKLVVVSSLCNTPTPSPQRCMLSGEGRQSSATGRRFESQGSHQQMAASSHDITSQCKPFMFNQPARSHTRQISLWTANKDDGLH